MIDDVETKLRLLEIAARTYGGGHSTQCAAEGIAKIARDWYNVIDSWKKSDTASTRTLTVPRKAPPT